MFVKLKRISYFGSFLGDREETKKKGSRQIQTRRLTALRRLEDTGSNEETKEIVKLIIEGVIKRIIEMKEEEEKAVDFLQMREVQTEVQRMGRMIKVEDMKEVWTQYRKLVRRKEEAMSIKITRGMISEMLRTVIDKVERDEEILLESEVNREKQEKVQKAEKRRQDFWDNWTKMEIDPEVEEDFKLKEENKFEYVYKM